MPSSLLGLGSNLDDRESTLHAALRDITALPDIQVVRHSDWYSSKPIGGPPGQGDFLNAAVLIETSVAPLPLLEELKRIEVRHGREQADRWSPRTLDIDLLLYGNEVMQTKTLTLPHPRMSFRRFVLEPAAQIEPKMPHPIIGWPIERLLLHLDMATDQVAIVCPDSESRAHLAGVLQNRCGAQIDEPPTFAAAEHHWPSSWTTWASFKAIPANVQAELRTQTTPPLPYAAAAFPKLSILLDAPGNSPADKLRWSTLVRQPGRGPTLRLSSSVPSEIDADEVLAAVEAVWPDLGPPNTNRLK
jgi:2-amino-4-hydroxy-6-hydroxymethyldihydropteridine diphosphokinase